MRVKIALFFTILFSILLITPTVITFIDSTQDVAIFLNINEEEENKKNNTIKEVKIYATSNLSMFFKINQKRKNVVFISKNYTSLHPKNTTPPPEFVL
ncbi:MAG: hypothetical protein ACPGUU_05875 [Flavobacteriaceae bacterium]